MTVQFSNANQAASVAPLDLITSAMIEAGILSAGEVPRGEDEAWCLEKLQRIVDQLNARRECIFSISFQQFNLLANHAPHTIGPTGDFNVPIRPVRISSASFLLNSTSPVPSETPIAIKDKDWWAANPSKTLTSTIVTHLYYDPSAPLGTLNFWPVSTIANPVRLEFWNGLAQAINQTQKLNFPQGYWEAMVLTLAVKLRSSFKGLSEDPVLIAAQREAMQVIADNNYEPPRIETDSGMPSKRHDGRPDFNFLTGLRE